MFRWGAQNEAGDIGQFASPQRGVKSLVTRKDSGILQVNEIVPINIFLVIKGIWRRSCNGMGQNGVARSLSMFISKTGCKRICCSFKVFTFADKVALNHAAANHEHYIHGSRVVVSQTNQCPKELINDRWVIRPSRNILGLILALLILGVFHNAGNCSTVPNLRGVT